MLPPSPQFDGDQGPDPPVRRLLRVLPPHPPAVRRVHVLRGGAPGGQGPGPHAHRRHGPGNQCLFSIIQYLFIEFNEFIYCRHGPGNQCRGQPPLKGKENQNTVQNFTLHIDWCYHEIHKHSCRSQHHTH